MRRSLPSLVIPLLLLAACNVQSENPGTISPSSAAYSAYSSYSSHSSYPSYSSYSSHPSSLNLRIPFTSQAPHANWGDPYQEACEEAAVLMAVAYLNGTTFTPDSADAAILDVVAWEKDHGYGQDIAAEEMATVAREKFGMNARVRTDVSETSIKEELSKGNPVVIPAAGRELGNPYFSGEGPWYHALIIRGYRKGWTGKTIFITNDPGTRRGEAYEYDADVLISAIHDWTGVKEEIGSGRKAMVIVEK